MTAERPALLDESLTPAEVAALADLVFEMTGPHTLREIAARLGMTHQAVSFHQKKALGKLRARMARD